MRQDGTAHQNRSIKIDLDGMHPFLPINVFDNTFRTIHPCIVHQDVNMAEFPYRCLNDTFDIIYLRYIRILGNDFLTGAKQWL